MTRYACLLIHSIAFDLLVTIWGYVASISKEIYERAENNDDIIIIRCEEIVCKFYHTDLLVYKAYRSTPPLIHTFHNAIYRAF